MAASVLVGVILVWLTPTVGLACSPPFEPTIRALGPAQVVVVGTTGEPVAGGRAFHVERWFNGDRPPTGLLVIAFKEGAPVGDCSYRVSAGSRLIIAPYHESDGRLSADLGTLQADPASEMGRKFVVEAMALFGPGLAIAADAVPGPGRGQADEAPSAIIIAALLGLAVAMAAWSVRARNSRRPQGPG